MAHAYAPGLKVAEATVVRKERKLPLQGDVIVKVGDVVKAADVVARTYLPGHVEPINIANRLGCEPREVPGLMQKQVNDAVEAGEVLAESKGFFGFFKATVVAGKNGRIESISDKTGQVMIREADIPVQISAFLDGVVEEVMPTEGVVVAGYGAFIQGIFGIGGETEGELAFVAERPSDPLDASRIKPEHAGRILVAGSYIPIAAIRRAQEVGAAGIVCGGMDDQDLRELLGYDLGVAITGSEEVGLTIVVTEGFGAIDMAGKTFNLLRKSSGRRASISGATQIRAGVIRPEVFIPAEGVAHAEGSGKTLELFGMDIGTSVRIIREPHFGTVATVAALPVELAEVESETRVRIVTVRLPDGSDWTLPRANVEVIGA
ncbi:MAG: hypothetical protein ACYCW6_20035 [Candidatus Xenobia bacterium]